MTSPPPMPTLLECFRVDEVVNVAVRIIVRGRGGGGTAVAAQESKGTALSTFSATFIDRAVDFFMGAGLETLAAPALGCKGRPKATVRPMSLAIASPTVCLASWTVE